ncbi:MAG: shikimate kinase [Lachnospiraceae bacterium]|nr:shikimate kinase [Lachnospiraceae bacterium]
MKNKNVVLIGFMACGKSTVGKKLAGALRYSFLDTDALIEETCQKKISQIFAEDGEEAFRQAETAALKKLKEEVKHCVIATGGGMPLREENVRYMREIGTVFFLQADIETILGRLRDDTQRPLAAGENRQEREERLRNLYAKRLPVYKEAAEICIDTEGKTFYGIIQEIEQYMGKAGSGQNERKEGAKNETTDN